MEKVPNYDVFGYCVKCGKRMISHEVIGGIYKMKLSGEYTTVLFKLNDGSKMRIAMCQHCANNLTGDEKERNNIMKKVWRGWQHEVETYSHWNDKKKKDYLEEYGKKRIVVRADKHDEDVTDRILNKYKEKKPKEDKHILKEK